MDSVSHDLSGLKHFPAVVELANFFSSLDVDVRANGCAFNELKLFGSRLLVNNSGVSIKFRTSSASDIECTQQIRIHYEFVQVLETGNGARFRRYFRKTEINSAG